MWFFSVLGSMVINLLCLVEVMLLVSVNELDVLMVILVGFWVLIMCFNVFYWLGCVFLFYVFLNSDFIVYFVMVKCFSG